MTSPPEPAFVRPRVAAGVLFLDETDRVLLVVPSYKDFLDLPGGYVEPGESPRAAAQREVREELAIEPPVGRLLVADWRHDSADGQGGEKILFVFQGGNLTPAQLANVTVDGDEVVGYRFHALTDLDAVTIPRLVTRIHHAVAAHHDGTTRYLEDGQPADPAVAAER
ncbi:MAG TPA: NUDIX hydrolase [Acidimicrobiales bacterium]